MQQQAPPTWQHGRNQAHSGYELFWQMPRWDLKILNEKIVGRKWASYDDFANTCIPASYKIRQFYVHLPTAVCCHLTPIACNSIAVILQFESNYLEVRFELSRNSIRSVSQFESNYEIIRKELRDNTIAFTRPWRRNFEANREKYRDNKILIATCFPPSDPYNG